jgi:signal transduction histidine kinase/ligand-binding sensor domain-containing protein
MRFILINIIFLVSFFVCYGQSNFAVNTITTAQGLPSNYIFQICQDGLGNIWAATDKGLSKYNGISWKTWDMESGLEGNYVNSITEDEDKGLFFTISGLHNLYYMFFQSGKIYMLAGTEGRKFSSLKGSHNGTIVTALSKQGGREYFKATFIQKTLEINLVIQKEEDIFATSKYANISQLYKSSFYKYYDNFVLTKQFIWEANANEGVNLTKIFSQIDNNNAVYKKNGIYYVTSLKEGLAIIDSATRNFTLYNRENLLPVDEIASAFVNKQGHIYLASFGGGIIILKKKKEQLVLNSTAAIKAVKVQSKKIYYIKDGVLNVLENNRNTAFKLSNKVFTVDIFSDTLVTSNFSSLDFYLLQKNGLKLLSSIKNTSGTCGVIKAANNFVFGSYGSGLLVVTKLRQIEEKQNLPFTTNEKITTLSDSLFAAVSYERGCFIANTKLQVLKHFTVKDGLPSNEVRNVVAHNDTLWIACKNGLAIAKNNTIINMLGQANGLKGNSVIQVLFYKNQTIVVSNTHVHVIRDKKLFPVKAILSNGNSNTVILSASLVDSNLLLATENNLFQYDLDALLETNKQTTPFFLSALVDGVLFKREGLIKLNNNFRQAVFYFGNTNSFIDTKTTLWYKISNNAWQQATDSNSVNINNLSAGKYSLWIKTITQNGTESDTVLACTFMVKQPWYLRWWAILLGVVLLGLAITAAVLIINKRAYRKKLDELRIQQELEVERQRISRDLHDNIGAYTTALIANVQQLKNTIGENEQTIKMQDNADQILNNLRETIWVLNNKDISVQEFNDSFKNYCFKVLRNFEGIAFITNENIKHENILKAAETIHMYNIMQEAIQNIIKHAEANEIHYSINDKNGLQVSIADNGIGFEEHTNIGFGVENMKWRAAEAGFTIEIQSDIGKGTKIIINTPKRVLPDD